MPRGLRLLLLCSVAIFVVTVVVVVIGPALVVALYFLLGLLLFIAWHSGPTWRAKVVGALDSPWGWSLPFGLFWKLGRAQGTLGDKWPFVVGGVPGLAVYRAGQRWTTMHGGPNPPRRTLPVDER